MPLRIAIITRNNSQILKSPFMLNLCHFHCRKYVYEIYLLDNFIINKRGTPRTSQQWHKLFLISSQHAQERLDSPGYAFHEIRLHVLNLINTFDKVGQENINRDPKRIVQVSKKGVSNIRLLVNWLIYAAHFFPFISRANSRSRVIVKTATDQLNSVYRLIWEGSTLEQRGLS